MRGVERTEVDGGASPLSGGSEAGGEPRVRIPHSLLVTGMVLVETAWIAGLAYLVYHFLI